MITITLDPTNIFTLRELMKREKPLAEEKGGDHWARFEHLDRAINIHELTAREVIDKAEAEAREKAELDARGEQEDAA